MTGDMAISLWMDPTATGSSFQHRQLAPDHREGLALREHRGRQLPVFQIGDKVVFEWNDRITNTHYQAITQNPVLGTNWNYVTTSVSGGSIKIYNNGVEQPLVFSQGLDPRSVTTPGRFPGRPAQIQHQPGHDR